MRSKPGLRASSASGRHRALLEVGAQRPEDVAGQPLEELDDTLPTKPSQTTTSATWPIMSLPSTLPMKFSPLS
jgi:hypothetical protein